MSHVILAGKLDVAELVFYAFVLFFIALVFYLRREDRREGYPVEDTMTGRVDSAYGLLTSSMYKTFKLPFDAGVATTPTQGREPVDIAARRVDRFPGAPYAPTGNPLTDGVGPAAYAQRSRNPDLDLEGRLRIVPISADDHFWVARNDPDPRGKTAYGCDGRAAGTVNDLWIDRSDRLIRYLEIGLTGGGSVLAPMMMAKVKRQGVVIDALTAAQFAGAPTPTTAGQLSRYDEERIQAYFGGGYLYATPQRQEPLL